MFQLFKPLTDRQHIESDLNMRKRFCVELANELTRITRMIEENDAIIQQLEQQLENMK